MKRLKKWIFKRRLQTLLKVLDFKQGTEFWLYSNLSSDDKKIKHRKDCDQLLLSYQPEERMIMISWLKKKVDWLVYENTLDKTDVTQNRLFQSLLEYNQVKALHEADMMKREKKELA